MSRWRILLTSAFAAVLLAVAVPVLTRAQGDPAPSSEHARRDEIQAAYKAGMSAGARGPAEVALIDQAVLKLPDGFVFMPKLEGARLMRALGNTINDDVFVGLLIGGKPGDHWIIDVEYIKEGYVKDEEAKNWDADKLLQSLKDGTEESNKDRTARGFPELDVLGWVEKPVYDSASRRLVWSVLLKEKGEPDSASKGINYNTYALGRDGYFSLNLLTDDQRVATDKVAALQLLAALSYNPGKRYEDFNAATDHIAEYGIAALVGGIVAKKLGLFALIAVFALKFAKVIGIAVLAFGAGIWNFFSKRLTRKAASGAE